MDHLIDLDAVAEELGQRRADWVGAGFKVGDFTWRDAAAKWPQPLVTDRALVADPESLGLTLRDGRQEAELVLWTGGWAGLVALIGGKSVAETPEFADVSARVAVADELFARLSSRSSCQ
jgi:hypothetical protein